MKNFAHLKPGSPLYSVFERGMAPLRHFMVRRGNFLNEGPEDFYELDLTQLSEAQIKTISEMMAERPGAPGSAAEAEAFMRREGFLPIRARHVQSVSADMRAFI